MPLLEVNVQAVYIDPSKPILIYCQEGYRATIAASILLRDHAGDIGILTGGVQEWQASSMPLERLEMSLSSHL
jgi:rhodanese-related sulfurtransferase